MSTARGRIGAFSFGTKAETLSKLEGRLTRSSVLQPFYFTVSDWNEHREAITEEIGQCFVSNRLIVRSSAIDEDAGLNSMAGVYTSVLDVDGLDGVAVDTAVEKVISQYDANPLHQVLIQPMLSNVSMSGVLMTRDLRNGGPYYVINYDDESGKTDTVTSGSSVNKTVSIYRDTDRSYIRSARIRSLVEMAEELEQICGNVPLDVEFGLANSDEVYLFQVRRVGVSGNWGPESDADISERLPAIVKFFAHRSVMRRGLVGNRTIFGIMPDWNPAELLGVVPGLLSISLFRELITRNTWREARSLLNYRAMPPEELMVVIEGRPYIDVRCSFNSFLPDGLDDRIGHKLVDAWLGRLHQHPELHDKVEFEIAHTILDFDFRDQFVQRYGDLLSPDEVNDFEECLARLTIRAVDNTAQGSLCRAENLISDLAKLQRSRPIEQIGIAGRKSALGEVAFLLDECKMLGTTPFSVLARHAFIAESLLQSAIRKGALTSERVAAFKRTMRTILSDMNDEWDTVLQSNGNHSAFLEIYGHLRPGTFDIRSPRYLDRDELFTDTPPPQQTIAKKEFVLTPDERRSLDELMLDIGLSSLGADGLLEYARRAISGREYAKFIFSRNLSDALEWLALWGEERGLTRDQLANIDLNEILDTLVIPRSGDETEYFSELAVGGERQKSIGQMIRLGALIGEPSDVYVVPMLRNEPNFITNSQATGQVIVIEPTSGSELYLTNRIACIESADPGFDWIFGKGIAGLVTKYGGANSHMAIRCAEFGLPGAIGCGEQVFDRIISAGAVEIDCREKVLRPIYDRQTATST